MFCDGFKGHIDLGCCLFAKEKKIELVLFKPNTTHITQPADIVVLAQIKRKMRERIHLWHGDIQNINAGRVLDQYTMIWDVAWHVFEEVFAQPEICQTAFRKAGLYPWNPYALDFSKVTASSVYKRGEFPDPNPYYDGPQEYIVPESAGVSNGPGGGAGSSAMVPDGAGARAENDVAGGDEFAELLSTTHTLQQSGSHSMTSSSHSSAPGSDSSASGSHSMTLGSHSSAPGSYSLAPGSHSSAPSSYSSAPSSHSSASGRRRFQRSITKVNSMTYNSNSLPSGSDEATASASSSFSIAPANGITIGNNELFVPVAEGPPVNCDMDLDILASNNYQVCLPLSDCPSPNMDNVDMDKHNLDKDYWSDKVDRRHPGSAATSSDTVEQHVTSPGLASPPSVATREPGQSVAPNTARISDEQQSEDMGHGQSLSLQKQLPHSAGLSRPAPRPEPSATVTSSALEHITSLEDEQEKIMASAAQKSWKRTQYELIFLNPEKVSIFEKLYQAGHRDVRNTDYQVTDDLIHRFFHILHSLYLYILTQTVYTVLHSQIF